MGKQNTKMKGKIALLIIMGTFLCLKPAFVEAADWMNSENQVEDENPLEEEEVQDESTQKSISSEETEQEENTEQEFQWVFEDGYWYYVNETGELTIGLREIEGKKYYFNEKGEMQTGWIFFEEEWYYFENSGAMATGWVLKDNTWYYLKKDGVMATGWLKENGSWYYLKSSGAMATGWIREDDIWYYLKNSGAMATGWIKENNTWYYLKNSGAMVTGWICLEDTWYYLKNSGAMVTGRLYMNNKWYCFMQSGAWVDTDYFYLGTSRECIVEELEAHINDSYYLGTRYQSMKVLNGQTDPCMHPNGSPGADGYTGMNCAGFVAFVIQKAGGDLSGITAMGKKGTYVNATSWIAHAKADNVTYYCYNSVNELLASDKAQKGDIIYCEPDWSKPGADCHIGFFWGNTSDENQFWHQFTTNTRTEIQAFVPQQRYYLIKTGE